MIEALEKTFLRLAALALVILASGCAGPRTITSGDESKPTAVGSKGGMPGYAEVEVERLILPNGPDAWTVHANWDEYGLVLRNPGSLGIVITALELVGDPGGSTWHTTWMDSLRKDSMARRSSEEQAARALISATVVVGWVSCHTLYFPPAIPMCLAAAAVAIPIGLQMTEDQATIDRRGLRLPLNLAPGDEIRGSAFFPATPAAQRLRAHLHIEGEDHTLELPFPGTP